MSKAGLSSQFGALSMTGDDNPKSSGRWFGGPPRIPGTSRTHFLVSGAAGIQPSLISM